MQTANVKDMDTKMHRKWNQPAADKPVIGDHSLLAYHNIFGLAQKWETEGFFFGYILL